MTEDIKDFDNYFIGSDITFTTTQWKQEGRDYWIIFLPLDPDNKPQSCLQKIGNEISRLDFLLREVDNKLVFNDITTKKGWYLDLTELSQSKIHLVGEHSKATFLKEPIVNLGVSL